MFRPSLLHVSLFVLGLFAAPTYAVVTTVYVDDKIVDPTGTAIPCGSDTYCTGLSTTCWSGSTFSSNQSCPKKTIQAGINATLANGDVVIVQDGTYKGSTSETVRNRNLRFTRFSGAGLPPRLITVRSANGAARCIIDCDDDGDGVGEGYAFDFNHANVGAITREAVVGTPGESVGVASGKGFTIRNAKTSASGAILISQTSPTIRDCIFEKNDGGVAGGAIYIVKTTNPLIEGCIFDQNKAYEGGAIYSKWNFSRDEDVQASILNCAFTNNTATNKGGGIYAKGVDGLVFSGCTFDSNTASSGGGGLYITDYPGKVRLANCQISRNNASLTSPPVGGGIYFDGTTDVNNVSLPEVMNCSIVGNKASSGGGLYVQNRTQMAIANSVFYNNTATDTTNGGHAVYFNGASLSPKANIANTIIWQNTAPTVTMVRASGLALRIEESDIRGTLTGVEDSDNIFTDPVFVDADGLDNIVGTTDDNLRLQTTSPCKENGDSALRRADYADLDRDTNITELTPLDKDFATRVQSTQIDMGAYEFNTAGVTCPTATISIAAPVTGTRDARRPHPQTDCSITSREGLGDRTSPPASDKILITLSNGGIPVGGAISTSCWSRCETGTEEVDTAQGCAAPLSNSIHAIVETGVPGVYEVQLNRPISGAHWTRITYTHSGGNSCVAYASLPGDIDANGTTAPADILKLIDCCLNQICTPAHGSYTCDINRDGVWDSADNTELQALLNGTDKYLTWYFKTLATNTSCPCGAFAMAAEGDAGKIDNYDFGDWFVNYLVNADPADVYHEQEFLTITGDLTTWVIGHFTADEQAYLVEQLSDPSLKFASDAGSQAALDVIAVLTGK